MHPTAMRILERAAEAPDERFSPRSLATEFGEPLGNVAHHVRVLHKLGFLKPAGTRPVRGAVEHHYMVAAKAIV